MAENSGTDRVEDVAPGDMIAVDRGSGEKLYTLVFKDSAEDRYIVTLRDDDGETFQIDIPRGTTVKRSLQAKWESPQSPTPHSQS
jgi:hypothetical protein